MQEASSRTIFRPSSMATSDSRGLFLCSAMVSVSLHRNLIISMAMLMTDQLITRLKGKSSSAGYPLINRYNYLITSSDNLPEQ
jgi:hypothetical protein